MRRLGCVESCLPSPSPSARRVSHGTPDRSAIASIPLAADDPFRAKYGIDALQIARTPVDPTRRLDEADRPPMHINEVTHWWDGSQLYGSDAATQAHVRSHSGGRLVMGDDGLLPVDPATGVEQTGFVRNCGLRRRGRASCATVG